MNDFKFGMHVLVLLKKNRNKSQRSWEIFLQFFSFRLLVSLGTEM